MYINLSEIALIFTYWQKHFSITDTWQKPLGVSVSFARWRRRMLRTP